MLVSEASKFRKPQFQTALATSAVLIDRVGSYLLPTVIGGGVAAALGVDRAASPGE